MAQIRQPLHHLRCLKCNGYGFLKIESWTDRKQVGERDCPVCSATGTKRRERIVEARPLGKLKDIAKMTIGELDQHVRRFAVDGEVTIQLTHFGMEESDNYDHPSLSSWLGESDWQQARKQGSGWKITIYPEKSSHLVSELELAASSLPVLLQSLARHDLEPE